MELDSDGDRDPQRRVREPNCPRGRRPAFTSGHLLAALRAAQFLKTQAKADATLALMCSSRAELQRRREELRRSGFVVPGRVTLQRARIRLDVAAMLWQRQWYRKHGPMYRYVCSDASPQNQQSTEVQISAERLIPRVMVRGRTAAQVSGSELVQRIMPVSALGQGRTDLPSKLQAHVHQMFCDYGPTALDIRLAAADVRQCLSDLGTEFGIANAADCVDQCLRSERPSDSEGRYLFPRALQVPGMLHILDWAIRSVVETLPFWPAWSVSCKHVVQYLHSDNHRQKLCEIIRREVSEAAVAQRMQDSLRAATTRFAQWRWKTLERAVSDLARVEEAARFCMAGRQDLGKALAQRDGALTVELRKAMDSDEFWDQARAVAFVIDRISELMSWVQGCECHGSEAHGQRCPWKGCRARSVSAAVQKMLSDMDSDR